MSDTRAMSTSDTRKRLIATITVPYVDVLLLREQRDALVELRSEESRASEYDILSGVINLLDAMIDIAECGRMFP